MDNTFTNYPKVSISNNKSAKKKPTSEYWSSIAMPKHPVCHGLFDTRVVPLLTKVNTWLK